MLSLAYSGDLRLSQEAVVQEDQHRVGPSVGVAWWFTVSMGRAVFTHFPLTLRITGGGKRDGGTHGLAAGALCAI